MQALTPYKALSVLKSTLPPALRGMLDADTIKAVKAVEPRFVAPRTRSHPISATSFSLATCGVWISPTSI